LFDTRLIIIDPVEDVLKFDIDLLLLELGVLILYDLPVEDILKLDELEILFVPNSVDNLSKIDD